MRFGQPITIKTILSLFLLGSLWLAPAIYAKKDSDAEKARADLEKVQQQISQVEKKLKKKRAQHSAGLKEIRKVEKQINVAAKVLRSTLNQIDQQEDRLQKLNREKRVLNGEKQQQKSALAAQIKSSYMQGNQAYLKLVLNQEDPAALGRLLKYYDYLNRARSEQLSELDSTLTKLSAVEQQIANQLEELQLLKQSKEDETAHFRKLKSSREKTLAALTRDIKTDDQRLQSLTADAKELQELIDSVQEALENIEFEQPLDGLASLKGRLLWPTNGRVIQNYGSKLNSGMRSNGVVIKASEGKDVIAIHHGRVVYADWLRGFGLLLIIDHGENYLSLYGYNQSLFKDVGDWVEAGEVIATVGQSGGQKQAALYFEIRHKGQPANPGQWVKRRG